MAAVSEGTLLWEPSKEFKRQSVLWHYMTWLREQKGRSFDNYTALWEWSVEDIEGFWSSIWDFFEVQASKPYAQVLAQREMPGARWFSGAELNYVEHVFRNVSSKHPAVIFQSERQPMTQLSWDELQQQVASVAAGLRALGVRRGDRVVAYAPNIPQALIAFLATASLGAVWSSCSPDFGSPSVIDRFTQIEPKVLFAVDGYSYGGKLHDRRDVVEDLQRALPTLERTVLIPYLRSDATAEGLVHTSMWDELLATQGELACEQVPFDHPLWVLYSSGTTGLPKPIVQGHGGILLEHLKQLSLQHDLKAGDRFFWFTTTGWMMWNYLIGGLLIGCTVLLYDGSPGWPDMNVLWEFAEQSGMTCFGTSAAYIAGCMKAGIEPGKNYNLSGLISMGSTGSPLPPEGFQWVYEHVKRDLWMVSASGGTDVCTAFVGGCPLWPVHAGEIQCRCLGAKVEAYNEEGQPVIGELGELVLEQPMPSMPLFFWNDSEHRRYRESYFEMYPGIWRHGDWIKITPNKGVVIYGRSDSTINRFGVRMGTSEIYSVVESIPEVLDSLVIDLEGLDGVAYMPLFVVLREGVELDEKLKGKIKERIRIALSPRHVPNEIFTITEVPRTLSGKKLEVPVKKILKGVPVQKAASPDSLRNPEVLDYFVELAGKIWAASKARPSTS